MSAATTREHIIEAADTLFYQQGFEYTSFSHIAQSVKISRGNFYYHFKTKDQILESVIELRLKRTGALLDEWERDFSNPVDRIRKFINILIINKTKIKRYGCPVGSLCTELVKLDHPSQKTANALFTLFRDWLAKQFVLAGREADANNLALHLLARTQGVATLVQSIADDGFVSSEVEQMYAWLADHIPADKTATNPDPSNRQSGP